MTTPSEPQDLTAAEEAAAEETKDSSTLRTVAWFSVGIVLAALGIYLGYEMRSRYKFKRRTPYDFYSNAGEQPGEFGVGI